MDSAFDIVMREDDFVLYAGGKPHLTPAGNEVSHANARLLRLCINQSLFPQPGRVTLLRLLENCADSRKTPGTLCGCLGDEETGKDPLLPGRPVAPYLLAAGTLTEDPRTADFLFINSSSLVSAVHNFLAGKTEPQHAGDWLLQTIRDYNPEKQAALGSLFAEYDTGLMIHCLLLDGFLSFSEYVAGLLCLKMKETLSREKPRRELTIKSVYDDLREKIVFDALSVVDFLMLSGNENRTTVIEELIQRGEDSHTEFKSTLRWDIRQNLKSAAIEHASLKTLCAFLNSEGGDLMIGVRDDGTIEGIETDQFGNNDRFLLHLWTLIRTCLGEEAVEWIRTTLQPVGSATVCRVNCRKAGTPVFLRQKGFDEAFYIRVGPSSNSLEISSALKYIDQHFKDNL